MALDGLTLQFIKKEIADAAVGCRIEKVHQPSREELVLVLRGRNGAHKLLLNAGANSPKIHFTAFPPENPAQSISTLPGGKFVGFGAFCGNDDLKLPRLQQHCRAAADSDLAGMERLSAKRQVNITAPEASCDQTQRNIQKMFQHPALFLYVFRFSAHQVSIQLSP
jgi:hypothetical protein